MSSLRRPPPEYSRSPDRRQRIDEFSSLYKLGHELGIGMDSVVYEARNLSTSEKCAVKVTDITKADLKMLQEESDLLCRLNHENIVKGYGIHITLDKVNIVVELVEGEELHSIISESGGLPEEDAIPLIYQLINAVIYLHDNKICHRDIKPENILISDEGKLKVIDFGLAARFDGNDGTMRACVGTQAYQAPEVLIGLPYTQGIDMWAVGATVYTVLSGTKPFGYGPFQRDSPRDGPSIPTPDQKSHQRAKILNGDYNFNDSVWEKISENGKNFVSQLLKVRPSDRMTPQDALNHPWLSSVEFDFRSWHFKWRSKSRDRREACRKEKREKGIKLLKSNTQRESHNDPDEVPRTAPVPRGHETLSVTQRKLKSQSVMYNTKLAISVPEVSSRSSCRQFLSSNSHRAAYTSDTDRSDRTTTNYTQNTDRSDRYNAAPSERAERTERSDRTESSDRSDRYSERYSKRSDRHHERTTDRSERSERHERTERPERPERTERTDYNSRSEITPSRVSYLPRTTLTPSRSGMTMSRHSDFSTPSSSRRKF